MHLLWKMILRTSKPPLPMLIYFSTQINVRHLELLENRIALKTTDYERDLGIWTSSTLTWSKQVLHQCAQANRSLGYIRQSMIKIRTISVRRMLYLTLVHSHLAYASQVWAPQSVDLIEHTERVQSRASKYILDLPFFCDINYNHRLSTLNLLARVPRHTVPF